MQHLISQRIGRYMLQKTLSKKAGRQTFLAKDLRTQDLVVVKVLQLDSAFEWDALKLFRREGKILQQLRHLTIPRYKDSFEADVNGVHSFILVQTYIAASSLQTVVEGGKLFSEVETITIAQQLLTTLSYLHQQLPPVIHRDIKPSNILIDEHSNANSVGASERAVYLVDFGAVQIAASKSSGTVTIVGSYGYMPLEQFLGQTTPASDLYSLGMTLLYLLTGMHPSELPQVDGHIQIERLGKALELSDWFTRWLSQMVAPYADHRFESSAIARAALKRRNISSSHFPHLRPDPRHLNIRRQKDKLEIFCGSSLSIKDPGFDSGFKGDIYALRMLINYLPKIVFPTLALGMSIIFFFGAFLTTFYFPGFGMVLGYLILISFTLIAFINLSSIFVSLLRVFVQPNGRRAKRRYKIISISRTLGVREGIARGFSPDEISSVNWTTTPSPFHNIRLLTYSSGCNFYIHQQKGRSRSLSSSISIPAKLSIHAGKREYSIRCAALSEAEQLWVAEELRDFIGLPLQRLNPTMSETAI